MNQNPTKSLKQIILVTGPSRSGKSEWAEVLAMQTGKLVTYVATAQADKNDTEWLSRINKHQQRRPKSWKTLLVPVELTAAILSYSEGNCCLLVDSLGTWVANLLEQEEEVWEKTVQEFLHSLVQTTATVVLVAEEVGWGVVPAYPLGRLFRDRFGTLVRQVGIMANPVYLVTGGHILNLSALGQTLPDYPRLNREIPPK